MIQKQYMRLGSGMRVLIAACGALSVLCLVVFLLDRESEDASLFLGLGGLLLALIVLIYAIMKGRSRASYNRLYDRVGEHGVERLAEEYQAGYRTKEAVFGAQHLFVEAGTNMQFDIIAYADIVWMHLYQHTTRYLFIPVLRERRFNLYLDVPERGRNQMIQINAKRIFKTPSVFFDQVIEKNPNLLVGYRAEWERMLHKDRESFIRFARGQQPVDAQP